jgi:hypothetical protein
MARLVLLVLGAPLVAAFAPLSAVPSSRASVALRAGAAPAHPPRAADARKSRLGLGLRMQADEGSASASATMPSSAALESLKGDLMTQLSVGTGLKGVADASNLARAHLISRSCPLSSRI